MPVPQWGQKDEPGGMIVPQLGQDCFGILDDLAELFPRVRLQHAHSDALGVASA